MKKFLKKYIIIISLILLTGNISSNMIEVVHGEAKTNTVKIYFFHSKTCIHCKEENKLLKKIEKKYNNVEIKRYEVHEEESKNVLEHVKDVYKINTNNVPITIIGESIFTGYNEEKTVISFIKTIEYYSRFTYTDKVMGNKK